MKVEVFSRNFSLKRPLATAHGVVARRDGFLVTVADGDLVGLGEAWPLASHGTESLDRCGAVLMNWGQGRVPADVAGIEGALGSLVDAPAARFALETALLDLLAQRRQLPLWRLLAREQGATLVRSSGLIDTHPAGVVDAARTLAGDGFETLKLKVGGRPVQQDALLLTEVRAAVGPRVKLRIDANGAWSEGEARSALRGFRSLDIELCEQPVASAAIQALRNLRGGVPCPIAADESMAAQTRDAVYAGERPAVDVVVLKSAVVGGLLQLKRQAQRAIRSELGWYATTMLEGAVAAAATVHGVLAGPESRYAHGLSLNGEGEMARAPWLSGPKPLPPDVPGLGVVREHVLPHS